MRKFSFDFPTFISPKLNPMVALRRYPLLLPLLAIVAGILLGGFLPFSILLLFLATTVSFILLVLSISSSRFRNFGTYSSLFFCLGFSVTLWQNQRIKPHHYSQITENESTYFQGTLLAMPVPTKKALRIEATLVSTKKNNKWQTTSGKIFLYTPQLESLKNLLPGDKILFKTSLQNIEPPANPHEFDYKNYLNLHQVYAQTYAAQVQVLPDHENGLFRVAAKLQFKLRGYIHQMQLPAEDEAIATALLLGYRYLITDETAQAFAGSGAMHVLAVSGLHVGILYLIISNILGINRRKPQGNHYLKIVAAIVIIWLYAFVTGLSPSVVRAATMFSFVAIGHLQKKKSATYQALMASALVLLALKPNLLFEVGFQLSYAAVFGILYIQPKIYNLIPKPKYWLPDQIWQITAVSFAAQAATFPLGLYYFHQFPVFFLVSNLLVIPLAWCLMNYGLFLLLVSAFITPTAWLVAPFKWLLLGMTHSVKWIEQLPNAVLHELWVDRFALLLIAVLVFLLVEVFFSKRKKALWASCGIILLLMGLSIQKTISQKKQANLTIYAVKNTLALEISVGKNGIFIAPHEFVKNEDAMLFHVRHNQWAHGLNKLQTHFLADTNSHYVAIKNPLIAAGGYTFLHYQTPKDSIYLALRPDFVLVQPRAKPPYRKIEKSKVILIKGHSPKSADLWKQQQPNCYNLGESGALVLGD